MKALAFALITSLTFMMGDNAPSMMGIQIHSSQDELKNIKLKVTARNNEGSTPMIKYKTENGNDFSVTLSKGKVVYLENDWLHKEGRSQTPLLTNFKFGETTLREIRKALGSNGFMHKNVSYHTTETHICMFNCFEVDSPNNEILVVITRIPIDTAADENNVADLLKLDALILADPKYLDMIWGKEKTYDLDNKKIKL